MSLEKCLLAFVGPFSAAYFPMLAQSSDVYSPILPSLLPLVHFANLAVDLSLHCMNRWLAQHPTPATLTTPVVVL